ncbi:MAG: hypothetical protein OWT27_10980, partial [Firmicutes bacterium]|nr:hypothetical protein [Bacillota bacterium]
PGSRGAVGRRRLGGPDGDRPHGGVAAAMRDGREPLSVDGSLDEIWDLYRLMHEADTPMETIVAAVDAYLRRAWLQTWIRHYARHLQLLGVDRVVLERGPGDAIAIAVDGRAS